MSEKKIVDINTHIVQRNNNHHRAYNKNNNNHHKKKKDNRILCYIIAALAACLVFCIWTILKDNDSDNSLTNNIPANGGVLNNDYYSTEQQNLFDIGNFNITNIENKDLWCEINFIFDFISGPELDNYRDSRGLVLVNCYAEYYNQDGAFEISQTYNITVSGDNTYSGNITCFDTTLTLDRISAIVFTVESFYGSHTIRVNFE